MRRAVTSLLLAAAVAGAAFGCGDDGADEAVDPPASAS